MIEQLQAAKRPWWRIIGPWPIRPTVLATAFGLFFIAFLGGWIAQVGRFEAIFIVWLIAGGAVLVAASWGIAELGRRWQQRHGVHGLSYLVVLIALGLIGPLARELQLVPETTMSSGGTFALSFLRPFALFAVTSAVAGVAFARVEREMAATREALDLAKAQQVQIIAADEEARRQVSMLLHDRVQAGLLSTCLELRDVAKRATPEEKEALGALAEKLESMRSIDVRRAARTLSPNLLEVGLQTALEDLAGQYETSFVTSIDLPVDVDRQLVRDAPFTALAIYRIVDQALLNAAVHAQATQLRVEVSRPNGWFVVTVSDNGIGLPPNRRPGLGTTIINTWVRATGGSWSLENSASGTGSLLIARVKPMSNAN